MLVYLNSQMAFKHIKYDLKTGPNKPFYEISRSYYSLIH
jgi:hypothetical protein